MKGLLKKDLLLFSEQKLIFIIMIGIVMAIATVSGSGAGFARGFVATYVIVMFAVSSTSTVSYDEVDNGLQYILTMPVSRKMYVNGKYIFGLVTAILGSLVVLILTLLISIISGDGVDVSGMVILTVLGFAGGILVSSISLPSYLKFGPQKGGVAMILILAILVGLVIGTVKILEAIGIDVMMLLESMGTADTSAFVGIIVVVAGICMLISYGISQKVMALREF